MSDTQGNGTPGPSQAISTGGDTTPAPGGRGPGSTPGGAAAAGKKKTKVPGPLDAEPMSKDFFKLVVNKAVDWENGDQSIKDYYGRFLGAKPWMEKIANSTFSNYQEDSLLDGSLVQATLRNSVDAKLHAHSLDIPQSTKDTMAGANVSTNLTENINDKPANSISQTNNQTDAGQGQAAADTPGGPAGYIAEQNLQTKQEAERNARDIQRVQCGIAQEYFDATSIQRAGRRSLYTTLINNTENHIIQKKFAQSPRVLLQPSKGASPSRQERLLQTQVLPWHRTGRVSSNLMLLAGSNAAKPKGLEGFEVSAQYLPVKTRQTMAANRLKAVRLLNPIDPLELKRKEEDATWKSKFETERKKNDAGQLDLNGLIDKYYAQTDQSVTIRSRVKPKSRDRRQPEASSMYRLRKKKSFSLCQTKFDDAQKLQHPLREATGPILINLATIDRMQKAKRFPIPEKLLHLPPNFELQIDSLMHAAYNNDSNDDYASQKPEIDAPCNSQESNEEIAFDSSDEEQNEKVKKAYQDMDIAITRKKRDTDILPAESREERDKFERLQKVRIHRDALSLHGFNMEILKTYPLNGENVDVPTFLLSDMTKKLGALEDIHANLTEEFKEKTYFPSADHLQVLFDHFCGEFDCGPLALLQFFQDGKLTLADYVISERTAKALACIMPLLPDMTHVVLDNNGLSDPMCALLLLAAFMSPTLSHLELKQNALKHSAACTLSELLQRWPNKIQLLGLAKSVSMSDHLDNWTKHLVQIKGLSIIDLSQIPISTAACKNIGTCLLEADHLKQLDVSNCKIHSQGTRYIIDGLNRNHGLQFLNFACNVLHSEVYEFAIKLAKILTRHESLMHLDLTATGLQKEEVIFIGMSLQHSRACIGLHLSLNQLSYYERIFLRILMNAKVAFQFRNMAQKAGIRTQQERNQVTELHSQDFVDKDLCAFLKSFKYIEQQSLALDEDISNILKNVDEVDLFKDLKDGQVDPHAVVHVNAEDGVAGNGKSTLEHVMAKIEAAGEHLEHQRQEAERFHDSHVKMDDETMVKNFKAMGLWVDKDKSDEQQELDNKRNLAETIDAGAPADKWLALNRLKIERIKQRVQQDALSQTKYKTPGEIALLFVGINKVANDLLLRNPMANYMSEVIFTRVLGCDNIEHGSVWKDTSQCWICEKWSPQRIEFQEDDIHMLKQGINKLSELDEVVQKCLDDKWHHMLTTMPKKKVKEFFKKHLCQKKARTRKGAKVEALATGQMNTHQSFAASSLYSSFRLETEVLGSGESIALARRAAENQNDPFSTIRLTRQMIERQLPRNINIVQDINSNATPIDFQDSSGSDDESVVHEGSSKYRNTQSSFHQTAGFGFGSFENGMKKDKFGNQDAPLPRKAYKDQLHTPIKLDNRESMGSMNSGQWGANVKEYQQQNSIFSQEPLGSQVPVGQSTGEGGPQAKRYRSVKKQVYFRGTQYELSEQESIDSDEVQTSDDEFRVDDLVLLQYNKRQQEIQEEISAEEKQRNQKMEEALSRTRYKTKSAFGRKQVFLCCSANDWIPIEMKTAFEMKLEKAKGEKLLSFLEQNKGKKLLSSQQVDNVMQYSNFVPPGKHFFYFIYDRKSIFVSPNHDIVRYKGTNVFLNQITVAPRCEPLAQMTLPRKYLAPADGEFKRDRSVFGTFIEDSPDLCAQMLEKDEGHGKLARVCKVEKTKKAVVGVLQTYYSELKNIFQDLVAKSGSTEPTLGMTELTQLAYTCKILDNNLNLVTFDRIFMATCAPTNKQKPAGEKRLHRYEFIEILVRLAQAKYADKIADSGKKRYAYQQNAEPLLTLADLLQSFITKDLLPNCKMFDYHGFRQRHIYQNKVDELLRKNETVISQLYAAFIVPPSQHLALSQVAGFVNTAKLNIGSEKLNICLVWCQMSRVDTMSDLQQPQTVRHVEFLMFICMLAHQIYLGTKQANLDLHLKVDEILGPLLKLVGERKKFTFAKKSKAEDHGSDFDDADLDRELAGGD